MELHRTAEAYRFATAAHCLSRPLAWLATASLLGLAGNAQAVVRAADLVAQCPAHFKWNDSAKVCQDDGSIAATKPCVGVGLVADGTTCKASSPAPKRQCAELAGYVGRVEEDGACAYDKPAMQASSLGDYLGDCIEVLTPDVPNLSPGHYVVTNQTRSADGALTLDMAESNDQGWVYCRAKSGGHVTQATDAAVMKSGALRYGWTWGALTMPYKYYPGTKTFTSSAPIGMYIGRRYGQAGAGFTLALAATISSVKADTVDPDVLTDGKPTITGTTNAAALSWAAGAMWDLTKAPGGRPFKAGVFVGADRVNADKSVSYRENGKPWVAIQIGYDFTDN